MTDHTPSLDAALDAMNRRAEAIAPPSPAPEPSGERDGTIPCHQCGERLPADVRAIEVHVNERHPVVVKPGAGPSGERDGLREALAEAMDALLSFEMLGRHPGRDWAQRIVDWIEAAPNRAAIDTGEPAALDPEEWSRRAAASMRAAAERLNRASTTAPATEPSGERDR